MEGERCGKFPGGASAPSTRFHVQGGVWGEMCPLRSWKILNFYTEFVQFGEYMHLAKINVISNIYIPINMIKAVFIPLFSSSFSLSLPFPFLLSLFSSLFFPFFFLPFSSLFPSLSFLSSSSPHIFPLLSLPDFVSPSRDLVSGTVCPLPPIGYAPVHTACFCEILARNYTPGAAAPGTAAPVAAAPGAWIIWSNILSSICSRSIIWICTAPGAYLDMLLEHCAF